MWCGQSEAVIVAYRMEPGSRFDVVDSQIMVSLPAMTSSCDVRRPIGAWLVRSQLVPQLHCHCERRGRQVSVVGGNVMPQARDRRDPGVMLLCLSGTDFRLVSGEVPYRPGTPLCATSGSEVMSRCYCLERLEREL